MDVLYTPRDIAARFDRPVDDLRRLLAFHGLRSGAPLHLAAFARKLEDSKPFRTDLTALLRSTRDFEHGRVTSDQMLTIVAVAVGGAALLDDPSSSPATTHAIALVLMLLAGIGGWSDTGDRISVQPLRSSASPADHSEPMSSIKPKFAAAEPVPTSPPETQAVDVRAFVRSDTRSEARSDSRSDSRSELRPDAHAEAYAEARSGTPHPLRREPLSEIVRPPAVQAPLTPLVAIPHRGAPPATPDVPVARVPISQTAPEPQPRGEAQLRAEVHRAPDLPLRPEPQPGPSAPWRPPAEARPTTGRVSSPSRPATAPANDPDTTSPDFGGWPVDQPDLAAGAKRRPVSRKLALDALLATAAVALLIFGVFEGLHSRHAAPHVTTATSSAPETPLPAAAPPTTPEPMTQLAVEPTVTPSSSAAPATSAAPPPAAPSSAELSSVTPAPSTVLPPPPRSAGQRSTPPTRRSASEDLPPAIAATPSTVAAASKPQPTAAPTTLTRAADLQAPPYGAVSVPESTMDGHLLATRKPVYPPAALAQHIGGTVVLRAFISTDGTVRRSDVLAGPPSLVNSALAAASWRRYRPFLFHGKPVEVQTEITYHYASP